MLNYVVNVMSAGVETVSAAAESVERERNIIIQIAGQAQVLFVRCFMKLLYVLHGYSCDEV